VNLSDARICEVCGYYTEDAHASLCPHCGEDALLSATEYDNLVLEDDLQEDATDI